MVEDVWSEMGLQAWLRSSAISVSDKPPQFTRGFKQRISIKDTDRKLWDGKNALSDQIEEIVSSSLGELQRKSIAEEPNLMLLEGDGISIGIRNSGTQPKTNVSLRLAAGIDEQIPLETVNQIVELLKENIVNQ